jgi:uncharacterized phage protein (TIGR01671 family)
MREILFRAKREDNGELVYGYYVRLPDAAGSVHMMHVPARNPDECNATFYIDPKTLSQFTGLTDKIGAKIFEGDIVEYKTGDKLRIGRVFFSDFRASFSVTAGKNGSARINNDLFNYIQNGNSVIVIGNIYDNPELIGGEY